MVVAGAQEEDALAAWEGRRGRGTVPTAETGTGCRAACRRGFWRGLQLGRVYVVVGVRHDVSAVAVARMPARQPCTRPADGHSPVDGHPFYACIP